RTRSAAITKYSPASSSSTAGSWFKKSRYCWAISAMDTCQMSTSCRSMRWSKRSRGPSKTASRTRYTRTSPHDDAVDQGKGGPQNPSHHPRHHQEEQNDGAVGLQPVQVVGPRARDEA